jgi:hypothetical protein
MDLDTLPCGIVSVNVNPTINHVLMSTPIGAFEAFLDLHIFLITNKRQIVVPKRRQKK